jgi:hypothetical protein
MRQDRDHAVSGRCLGILRSPSCAGVVEVVTHDDVGEYVGAPTDFGSNWPFIPEICLNTQATARTSLNWEKSYDPS